MTDNRRKRRPLRRVEFTSALAAPADEVWASATAFTGINAELRPLLRMTAPREWQRLDPERIQLGRRLFRSWLLLFGVLPIEFDDLTIVELGPGYRFLERSRMATASVWEHERVVVPTGPGSCRVIDRVAFVPRWALLGPVLGGTVPQIFAHRHRRLRGAHGEN